MPDHVYRTVLTFQKKSGIPADKVDWDFHFRHAGSAPSGADFDALTLALSDFLNVAAGGSGFALNHWLSDSLSTSSNGVAVNYYLLPAAPGPTGAPASVSAFTLGGTGGNSLPDELAACLSYESDVAGVSEFVGATRPRARRRNRTYIGPLSQGPSVGDATTHEIFIGSGLRTDLTEAARDWLFAAPAAAGWSWEVVSRLEWTSRAVFAEWVDNAFDIQRRRGQKATVRTFVTL